MQSLLVDHIAEPSRRRNVIAPDRGTRRAQRTHWLAASAQTRNLVRLLGLLIACCFVLRAAIPADNAPAPETTAEVAKLVSGTLLQKVAILSSLRRKQNVDPAYFGPLTQIAGDASVPEAIRLLAAITLRKFPTAHATVVPILVQGVLNAQADPQSRNE